MCTTLQILLLNLARPLSSGDGDNRICVFGPDDEAEHSDPTQPEPWSLLIGN